VSVISRLDGQVEKILIEPIGRRRPADEATSAVHADTDRPRQATATPTTPGADQADRARPPLEDEPAGRPDALPVWLL
jgi:hypothetical protein